MFGRIGVERGADDGWGEMPRSQRALTSPAPSLFRMLLPENRRPVPSRVSRPGAAAIPSVNPERDARARVIRTCF